jgi:hypothetical protein
MIKGFSLVNQMSNDAEYKNFWNDENSFSDLIRGGSMQRQLSGGQSSLIRGLSVALSRQNSNSSATSSFSASSSNNDQNAIVAEGNEDPFFGELASGSGP